MKIKGQIDLDVADIQKACAEYVNRTHGTEFAPGDVVLVGHLSGHFAAYITANVMLNADREKAA